MNKCTTIISITLIMASLTTVSFGQCRYTSDYVPNPIKQDSSMGCWATVLTMMYEYKQKTNFTVPEIMNTVGQRFKNIYYANTGLGTKDKNDLFDAVGLAGEGPADYTLQGWCDLLNQYGPLWVTTDELPNDTTDFAIHARLLYGMITDTTKQPNVTSMYFIDPDTGNTVIEDFNVFITKYEAELKKDYKYIFKREWPDDFRVRTMVVHWKP